MEHENGGGRMSFENWNRFVKETTEKLKQDKETRKQGGKAAGSETTGGGEDERKGERSAQSL